MGEVGWRLEVSETLLEEGKFLSCPRLLHALPASLLRTSSPFRVWRAGGLSLTEATMLCAPHYPKAPQQGNVQRKLRGSLGCCAGPVPTLPARRAPISGPLIPDPRVHGALFPSHLLPVHLSERGGEGAETRKGCLPAPTSGGGRANGVGARKASLCSPSPQSSESALAAAAAAAAAWGGDCASPRLRSAGDLNATETVIHHCGSQQTFAGGSAIG